MNLVWISKRRYTHQDAFTMRYGRVYEVPAGWARSGENVALELIDYQGTPYAERNDNGLEVRSTSVRSITGMQAVAKRLVRHRPDVIVASGDCFVGLFAWRLAHRARARFVFDVYDDYRAFGAYRAFAGLNVFEYLCRRAERVLFASRALAERIALDAPWTLVPNGIDPAMFRPMPRATARAAVGLAGGDTRWVGYFGGMEPERGPDDLVTAVGELHAYDPRIRLVMCGPHRGDPTSVAPWVEHRGMVPHASVPSYINACDVVALPYRRGPIIDMASSVKIAEYLFCERPVVATRTPNLMENFGKQAAELGEAICNPGDPQDLARAILAQLRNPVIASPPVEHTWQHIADATLAALRNC